LKQKKNLPTDLVISSIGILPNKELAEKAGIEVNKGIVVNDYLETSVEEDVYAAGDCAEYKGRV